MVHFSWLNIGSLKKTDLQKNEIRTKPETTCKGILAIDFTLLMIFFKL